MSLVVCFESSPTHYFEAMRPRGLDTPFLILLGKKFTSWNVCMVAFIPVYRTLPSSKLQAVTEIEGRERCGDPSIGGQYNNDRLASNNKEEGVGPIESAVFHRRKVQAAERTSLHQSKSNQNDRTRPQESRTKRRRKGK